MPRNGQRDGGTALAQKCWNLRAADPQLAARLQQQLGLPELACRVLAARGVQPQAAGRMLQGEEELTDPYSLRDMDRAVARIRQALQRQERIAVFGDYDCDGVCAAAMVYSYLENLGADVSCRIPEREGEGYGLNRGALARMAREGVTLVVTVDNGISAREEVAYAAGLGMDVVVTDHHRPPQQLPQAAAVVDPHRADCASGCGHLCGAGVAFKLLCALEGDDGGELLEYYGDLLAIATVADVVNLVGENRLFVRRGLLLMQEMPRPGVAALLEQCGLGEAPLSAQTLAFSIGPRINAAGRLSSAALAVQLLLTEDEEEASQLAGEMQQLNTRRRALEQQVIADIDRMLQAQPRRALERVLVLCGQGWHSGVVGIVCSRMVERYGRPCLILTSEGDEVRGSGRSVEGFSFIGAITACSEYFTRFGGHDMAVGFSMQPSQVQPFIEAFGRYLRENHPQMPLAGLTVDCLAEPGELEAGQLAALEQLGPFGTGNEPPVFACTGMRVEKALPTADQKHTRLRLSKGGASVYAVFFGAAPWQLPVMEGELADVAFTAQPDVYNGQVRVNVQVKSLWPSGAQQQEALAQARQYELLQLGERPSGAVLPGREQIAAVYRFLRASQPAPANMQWLCGRLAPQGVDGFACRVALRALRQMGLVQLEEGPQGRRLRLAAVAGKVDISQAPILKECRD